MKTLLLFFTLILASYQGITQAENWGCTDPNALNYSSIAFIDDGSCCYTNWVSVGGVSGTYSFYVYSNTTSVFLGSDNGISGFCANEGCFSGYVNYASMEEFSPSFYLNGNLLITFDENTLIANGGYFSFEVGTSIAGCTDYYACNYDPSASCENGTCDYSCFGCTDPSAPNYDATATIDDGTCCTDSNYITVTIDTPQPENAYFSVYNSWGLYYDSNSGNSFCIYDGCYHVDVFVIGDESTYNVTITDANGNILASDLMSNTSNNSLGFVLNAVAGCTDTNACNFNPEATCYDYSLCDYSCLGCTNPAADNYDPNATVDNGTCCTETYTITASGACSWGIWSNNYATNQYGAFPDNSSFCLDNGCFNIYFTSIPDSNTGVYSTVNWQITDSQGNIVLTGTTGDMPISYPIENGVISGCTDTYACNFNPNANCLDYTLCEYSCFGCTDPNAPNYDPTATIDNGSCCTQNWFTVEITTPGYWYVYNYSGSGQFSGHWPEQTGFCIGEGCFSLNFYPDDFTVGGTVTIYEGTDIVGQGSYDILTGQADVFVGNNGISGCTDYYACNYDPAATCSDYSACTYDCFGCTNPNAPNYDPSATVDDGTCCFNTWYTMELSSEAYWSVSDNQGLNYSWGTYPLDNGFCMEGECFQLNIWSIDGTSLTYTVYDLNGNTVSTGTADYYGSTLTISTSQSIIGCADPNACNFNPAANCNDYYSCDYSCYGCTDPSAPNYDPTATFDDNTCCTANWYTLSISGSAYWAATNGLGEWVSGIYPEQNGFCMSDGCFSLFTYSLEATEIAFSILDVNGNVVYSDIAYPMSYNIDEVSFEGEVPGCMDATACNYNPEATCNSGGCNYYCGGCLDSSALNFDQNALYDDGSCFYTQIPPQMGMAMIPDETNNQFYVMVSLMDQGNGAPYVLQSNYDGDMMMMNTSGQYMAGPYPCDETISFSLQSMEAGLATYMTTSMDGQCAISTNVESNTEEVSSLLMYPNPSDGNFMIAGLEDGRAQIKVSDLSGKILLDEARNINGGKTEMNIGTLPNGIYQITIVTQQKALTSKMIVRK